MEKLTTTTASVGNLNLFTAKTKIYISRISLINIYWPKYRKIKKKTRETMKWIYIYSLRYFFKITEINCFHYDVEFFKTTSYAVFSTAWVREVLYKSLNLLAAICNN